MRSFRNMPARLRKPFAIAAALGIAVAGLTPVVADAATGAGAARSATRGYAAGVLSGTVKTPSGKGAKYYWITLEKGQANKKSRGYTYEGGKFTMQPWITSSYRAKVGINRSSGESRYIGGYWVGNGKKITASYAKGKTITVARNHNIRGIRPVLTTCAAVSGTVKNGTRATTVLVFNDANKALITRADTSIGQNGKYTVRGLTKGKYYVVAVQTNGYSLYSREKVFESYYGTRNGKKPSRPNLVIDSCRSIKNINFKAKKVVSPMTVTTIKGTALPGHVLTAVPAKYNVKGVKLTYQWYQGRSKLIKGATSRRYTVRPADLGGDVQIRILARKPGYVTGVARESVWVRPQR